MKLIIADHHSLFRDALVGFITEDESEAEIQTAKDLQSLQELLEKESDKILIILDIQLPGLNAPEGIRSLLLKYPDSLFAVMSSLYEDDDIDGLMELGISGYFPKTFSGKAMMKAIRLVLNDYRFIPGDHHDDELITACIGDKHFAKESGKIIENPLTTLTPRENEVLGYLMEGAANKEIARDLDLQVVTVKLHVRGICRKLEAKNRTQAALIAKDHGYTKR